MNLHKVFLILLLIGLAPCAYAQDFTECRLSEDTTLPNFPDKIAHVKARSLAVTPAGNKVGKKELLADTPIFFQAEDGTISQSYFWLYSPISKVEGRDDLFVSTPPGDEVVIIKIRPRGATPNQVVVRYTGERYCRRKRSVRPANPSPFVVGVEAVR
jgi:hypothetical protein